jgi:hypothetical protein
MSNDIYTEISTCAGDVITLDCFPYNDHVLDCSTQTHKLTGITLVVGSVLITNKDGEFVLTNANEIMQFANDNQVKIKALENNTNYKLQLKIDMPIAPSEEIITEVTE